MLLGQWQLATFCPCCLEPAGSGNLSCLRVVWRLHFARAAILCRVDSSFDETEEASPYTALVAGPCWSVPLKPRELSDFVDMLSQLRSMVANLAAQGQWNGASSERPDSRVKVSGGRGSCNADAGGWGLLGTGTGGWD